MEKNRDALGMSTEQVHDVGNHSFHHEPWLHLYYREKIDRDVLDAEEHITRATGWKPTGFRGPGFSWSPDLLDVLIERGYLYDASTFPTFLGPLARMYYFRTSNLTNEEKKVLEGLQKHQPNAGWTPEKFHKMGLKKKK